MASTLNSRQKEILDLVRKRGFVTIEILAADFDVSAQTVRRDIIHMGERGLLKRFHGGAGTIETPGRHSYTQKKRLESSAKIRIGKMLAEMLPDGASVFLDVGTTVEAAAAALAGKVDLRVFTASIAAALAFAASPTTRVEVAGGLLAGIDGALTGSRTTEWLGALRPDYAVIACSGIEEKGGVLDFDVGKTDIKRCAMRHARCNILVVDHTKFGRQALIRFADLSEFDVLISDQPVSPEFLPADVSGLDIRIPN